MLATKIWLELPQATRKKVATYLEIPRSGVTEVSGGRVISDGYTMNDLAQINLERLQKLFNTEDTDFYKLFNRLVANLEAPMIEVGGTATVEAPIVKETEVLGEGMLITNQGEVSLEGKTINNVVNEVKVKFCEFCESKGVRHLKTCTRPTK